MVAQTASRGGEIYDEIIKALEKDGELDAKSFRRLVLFALVDLGVGRRDSRICKEEIRKVDERVEKLEKFTILIIASKHPKAAFFIVTIIVIFVILILSHLALWDWIGAVLEEWSGVPIP